MYDQKVNMFTKPRKKGSLNETVRNSLAFSRDVSKNNVLSFELERTKDAILKLKSELAEKNKEISLLKVKNAKQEKHMQRTIKSLEEIMKHVDKSTLVSLSVLQKNRSASSSDFNKKANLSQGNYLSQSNYYYDSGDEDNNNNNNQQLCLSDDDHNNNKDLPPLKDLIHLSEEQKRSMKNII